jgi:hypothetical protein
VIGPICAFCPRTRAAPAKYAEGRTVNSPTSLQQLGGQDIDSATSRATPNSLNVKNRRC